MSTPAERNLALLILLLRWDAARRRTYGASLREALYRHWKN